MQKCSLNGSKMWNLTDIICIPCRSRFSISISKDNELLKEQYQLEWTKIGLRSSAVSSALMEWCTESILSLFRCALVIAEYIIVSPMFEVATDKSLELKNSSNA